MGSLPELPKLSDDIDIDEIRIFDRVVSPPRIVLMTSGNHQFKILMRQVESRPGARIWEVRLYREGNNPPGWEPVGEVTTMDNMPDQ